MVDVVTKNVIGAQGEQLAAGWLRRHGMQILATNWTCQGGEIDIVARDGTDLVVVEVKTRTSTRFGMPSEAVLGAKYARLRRLAGRWLAEHQQRYPGVRIDVVAILLRDRRPALLQHLRGVD